MIQQIDHIGIAVKNLNQQLQFYTEVLGLTCDGIEDVPDQRVKVAIFKLAGVRIELIQPTAEDSPVAKFLAQRGEGLHHIAYRVDDMPGELKRLAAHQVQLIDPTPRIGAGGQQIAFLHPRSTLGVLIELCQPRDPSMPHSE